MRSDACRHAALNPDITLFYCQARNGTVDSPGQLRSSSGPDDWVAIDQRRKLQCELDDGLILPAATSYMLLSAGHSTPASHFPFATL